MSKHTSMVCHDSEKSRTEEDGSVEEAALREDIEVVPLREGIGEARRRREDPAEAEDNFCV